MPIINQLINQINEINYSLVSVDEIQKNMNYEKDFNFNHENKQTEQFQIDTLEVKNLTFSYGEKNSKNLNFSFSNGELLGIFGPSGSGKTTLINLIMGFINPTEGKIYK